MKSFLFNRHNFLIGFIISVIVTATILPFVRIGRKYQLTVKNEKLIEPNYIFVYKDLDHNGNSEELQIIKNAENRSALILKESGRALFQWNVHGKIVGFDFLCTGNDNSGGADKIFLFTYNHDSIFLNGYNYKQEKPYINPLFLFKYKYFNGQCDIGAWFPQFRSPRHNGHKELFVAFSSGFSKSHRKVFEINLKSRTFRSSPVTGTSFQSIRFVPLNNCSYDDIVGQIYSPGNYSETLPFSDRFLWFYVYNPDLQFLFKPVKLGDSPGSVHVYPFFRKGKQNLLAIYVKSNASIDSTFLAIANGQGKILRYRKLLPNQNGYPYRLKVFPPGNKYRFALYHSDNGLVEYLNGHLNTVKTYQSAICSGPFHQFDLNGDGKKEEVYFGKDQNYLVVSRYDFTSPVVLKFNGETGPAYFSERWEHGKPVALCLSLPHRYYEFSYSKNPLYTFRFLIFGGIFILIFLLVNLIGYYYQRLIKIRYNATKRIQDNQLKSIEMQLNPHFILNTLNSIGALYEKKETQSARIYMGKYSKLLRHTLLTSGQIAITLEEELDFVKNFLDLEQFRHDNQFTYNTSCNPEFQSIQIPRLLVHTFVENAIKHGLYPILGKRPGFIEIKCSEKRRSWIIEITDNGIGMNAAKEEKTLSTGKGLEILNETLSLYRSVNHQKITFKMTDLNPGTEYPGTKVTIHIGKQVHNRKTDS